MAMVFPSGSHYCFEDKCGIYFWGIHSHDSIWHLALIESSFSKFPFIAPTFSEGILSGYNYLYDLVVFLFTKIGISSLFLFFKFIPFLWFILYVVLLIVFAIKLNKNMLFMGLLLFFTLFTGSFSYYFTLIKDHTISGSYGYLSQLPMHIMMNIQFALSLLGILYIMIKIQKREINLREIFIFGLIIFVNLGLKFYGGVVTTILVISYLLVLNTCTEGSRSISKGPLVITQKIIKSTLLYLIIIFGFFGISILTFYNPFASLKSGSIFSFAPFSIVHPITEDPSLFYLQKITDARYFLLTKGIGLKLILIETLNLTLFLLFYLGVRFFGIVYLLIKFIKRKYTILDATISLTMIGSTMLTVLLVQKAEWWNSIQFFYYAIFLSTIYITELSFELIKKFKRIGFFCTVIFVILAIPSTLSISEWSFYYPGNTYLPDGEYEALKELKKLPDGVVYSPIFDKDKIKQGNDPAPLYMNGDNAYVSAFSGKQSYLADILQLRLTGIDYQKRLNKINNNDCSILKEIDYIYFNNDYKVNRSLFDCESQLKLEFGNRTASLYKVLK